MRLFWSHDPLGGGVWGANCETGHMVGCFNFGKEVAVSDIMIF